MDQQELKKIRNLKGEVRGVSLKTDANYVLKKIGKNGLVELQEKTKEFGQEIDYENIKTTGWYPISWRVISLLAIKEVFDWGDEEIKEMGNCAPKYSFVANTMLRYFLSIEKVFQEASRYWQKHYTVGYLEPLEIDESKKYGILRLKDFKIHPILCVYLAGYFLRISQFVVKSKKITIEETECMFKGASCHQFLVKWL